MKTKSLKKIFLILIIAFISVIIMQGNVKAGNYSREYLSNKFNEIRNTVGYRPGDRYTWNDGGWFSDYCGQGHGGYQCHGYGINLFDWLFQQCAMCHQTGNNAYNLYVGDMVRVDNDTHTILIQDIVGDTIYYTDANWGWTGTVRWDVSISRSDLQNRLTYVCHADGNDIRSLTEYETPDVAPTITDFLVDPLSMTKDTVVVKAKATDDKGVTGVKFRVWRSGYASDSGTTKWGTYNSSTGYYEVTFSKSDTKTDGEGLCCIEAWAYDEKSNESQKAYVYNFVFANKASSLGNFTARIITKCDSNFCLGVEGNNNGDNLKLKKKDLSDTSQLWKFEEQANGSYKITNVQSGKSFDTEGGADAVAEGTPMQVWQYDPNARQHHYMLQEYNGGYRIIPGNSKEMKAIDIVGGDIYDNQPIWLYSAYEGTTTSAQTWTFENIATTLKLGASSVNVPVGETRGVSVFIDSKLANSNKITITSSNTSIATVSYNGANMIITGKKAGTAIITVKTTDGSNLSKTCAVTVNEASFYTDVKTSDWYYSAVKYCKEKGIILGTTETTFNPNTKLTRGMIVTILHRMDGKPAPKTQNKFKDVYKSQYYYDAVIWATEKGIVHGYGDGSKFGPDDNITRQDLAVILRNFAQYKGKNVIYTTSLEKFSDWKTSSTYARTALQWAVGTGVITGNNNGKTLTPRGTSTRAEAAGMIYNYCTKVKDSK